MIKGDFLSLLLLKMDALVFSCRPGLSLDFSFSSKWPKENWISSICIFLRRWNLSKEKLLVSLNKSIETKILNDNDVHFDTTSTTKTQKK